MYLSFFDPVPYKAKSVSVDSPTVLMTDIFKDYKSYFDLVAVNYKLISHYIQGAPRPEQLAYELYGNTQLYWVILMANSVYDPFHGWIKPQESVYRSAVEVYDKPHEQIDYHIDLKGERYYNLVESPVGSGEWYDKGDEFHLHKQYVGALAAVSINEGQILANEEKRQIKIISPNDIDAFVSDFIREMERV